MFNGKCVKSKCKVIHFAGGIYLLHKAANFSKSQQAIAFEKKMNYFLATKFEPFSDSFLPE